MHGVIIEINVTSSQCTAVANNACALRLGNAETDQLVILHFLEFPCGWLPNVVTTPTFSGAKKGWHD
jgi:hypothetical protein